MTRATSYLNAVRAFEAAARHNSFARAAAELCVSHTVVSRHIRNLEKWLGTDLFVRSGNRVTLTDDARMIAPKITAAFQSVEDSFEILRNAPRARRIRISAEPTIASRWLRRRLREFQDEFPDIEVAVVASRSPPEINDGTADVVIHFDTWLPAAGPGQHRLFPIDARPACSPEYLRRHSPENGAQGIGGHELVHDHGMHIWREWFAIYEPDSGGWRTGRIYSDLSLALEAAVDGEGVILADDILCAREFETGALVRLDDRILRCAWYCAVFAEAAMSNPSVAAFRAWLRERET